jgi:diketogulonate reductase-like aldo/keto reductase
MHCQDAVEADATWHASWRALEKAYAEGAVMSIGVSNFNEQLMQEVIAHGIVRPHLVQNHADMENLDLYVRELCQRYGILFMPYAFQRNYRHLSGRTVRLLEDVAAAHGKTPRDVILRFFVQTGAVIIPRSDDPEHLAHNLDASFGWSLSGVEMASLGWPSDLSAWLESQSEGQHEL